MSQQPNILFIISDQMTTALTGVYGHPVVQTPHLNRLAGQGTRFDSAYTPFPLCSPGRACLMTGPHASAIGAWDNGALHRADQPTFAHYLANAGYDTVLSGKMHFVGPEQLHDFRKRLNTDIYSSDFDSDAMAQENLASLYRRRLIRDTMKRQSRTWAYYPEFDARHGAMEQYLP